MTALRRTASRIAAGELILLAAAAPLLLFPTRWTPLAVAAIAFLWLCRWAGTGRLGLGAALDVPVAVLLAMAAVGLCVSLDRGASLPALWRLLLGVAVFYGIAHSLRTASPRRLLAASLILAGLALALLTLLGTGWDRVRLFNLPQLYARLPAWLRDLQDQQAFHPRLMGMALATWLPLPLALLFFGRGAWQRLWAGVTVLVMGVMLLLTQSLQALVGLGCAVLLLGVFWSRWFVLSVPLLGAAGLLVLKSSGWRQLAAAALSVGDRLGIAAALRIDMWSRAWAMIRDMPYTGIGLDSFPVMQWHFYPGVLLGTEPHAHNWFLQVALDLGLPGLFALLWLLGALCWAAARAYRRCEDAQGRALLLGTVASIVSYLGCGLLDTMWASKAAVLLWVVLGLAAGLSTDIIRIPPRTRDGVPVNGCAPRELDHSAAGSFRNGRAFPPATQPVPDARTRDTRHPLIRFAAGHPLTILLLLILLLIPGLLLPRNAFGVNRSLVSAHQALLPAERGESPSLAALVPVARDLRRMAPAADNPHLYSLLGQAEAWLGEDEAALAAFERRLELDGRDPLASYAPFEGLRRWVAGEGERDRWEDAVWIYGQWAVRFPQRAEAYMLTALVRQRQGRAQVAAQVLRSALQKGAQPRAVLEYALAQLTTGTQ